MIITYARGNKLMNQGSASNWRFDKPIFWILEGYLITAAAATLCK